MNNHMIPPFLVLSISFVVLWLSARIGAAFRKRQALDDDLRHDLDVVVAANLTLLGLIIGFSFSMATSRYDQRKNYEEAEANAIGTEYVRADLLPAADAARVRALLSDYLDQRVLFYQNRDEIGFDRSTMLLSNCRPICGPLFRLRCRSTADTRARPGRFRHERCVELAGIHAGRLVESNPSGGMGPDGGDRHLRQPDVRLWCAPHKSGVHPPAGSTARSVHRVSSHSRHRQPA